MTKTWRQFSRVFIDFLVAQTAVMLKTSIEDDSGTLETVLVSAEVSVVSKHFQVAMLKV